MATARKPKPPPPRRRVAQARRNGSAALSVAEDEPQEPSSSWAPVDLAAIVAGIESGEVVGPVPTLLRRTDGQALLYRGEVQSISGEPETGKGWFALAAVAEALRDGGTALYVDFEDAPVAVVERLLALGVAADALIERLIYVRPVDPPQNGDTAALLDGDHHTLVILDGMTEAYGLLGLKINDNDDAAKFLNTIARPLADTGAAVLEIDHVTRDPQARGRFSLGAGHKLAGVAAAYIAETLVQPNRRRSGRFKLRLVKDRHGHVGNRGPIGLVHIEPSDGGRRVVVRVEPPDGKGVSGEFRPTALMERVSRVLEEAPPEGVSRTQLRTLVKGNSDHVDKAAMKLVEEGYAKIALGARSAVIHRHVKPFRAESEEDRDHDH
jgi:AAA domain